MTQPTDPATDPATDPLPVTSAVVDQIAGHVGDSITPDVIHTVLTAWNAVRQGDPVGMIRRDETTGAVATRVEDSGVQMWKCSGKDGSVWSDLQPTLASWTVIYDPSA